jgi:hypothetical protein
MKDEKNYVFNPFKNESLQKERGISFEEIIQSINLGRILAVLPHSNSRKYRNQHLLIIEIKDYAYVVPCIMKEKEIFLKTAYPSRKATKIYLKK